MSERIQSVEVVGQYDTNGAYAPYHMGPIPVRRFGDTLRDSDGFVWAVLDEYGDWVSPTMLRLGLKSKIEVSE